MAKFNIAEFKFLHVDDFANYRSMMKAILSSIGVTHMDDAKDANDALEMIQRLDYDVILCDYNLGDGQNGQQLLEEAMSRGLMPYGTIFIMITAENTMDMVMAAVEYRPDAYLSKPFPKDILIRRLEKLMAKKEAFKPIYKAYNNKKYSKAIELCDKQMASNHKLALDIGKLKAEIAIKAKDFNLASEIYDKALAIRPFDWAQYGKGKTLYEKGDYNEAQEALEDLVETNKNYIEAYDILAKIYKLNDDSKKVQQILVTATNISPRAITRQQELSHVAMENNDFKIAEKSMKSSISLGKYSYLKKIEDHTNLTKLYVDNNQTSNAVKVLANARVEYKKEPAELYHVDVLESIVEQKLGHDEKARDLFEKIIHSMPDDIHNLPKSLQNDIIANGVALHESEMVESLKHDIDNPSKTSAEERKAKQDKYKYLLINGKGMREYKNHRIGAAAKLFDQSAAFLTDNISINMNAAQAYIMFLRESSNSNPKIKEKIRKYLNASKLIDSENEKYKKLEILFSELN